MAVSAPNRCALLVMGMHRSGTSAVSRWLSLLGADLPVRLLGANESNTSGYWESPEVVACHDALLAMSGLAWSDVGALAAHWQSADGVDGVRDRLHEFLVQNFKSSARFVVKDPRICRFVPLWLALLQDFAVEPKLVVPFRNPVEVAASLSAREGSAQRSAALLWLQYTLEAEQATRGRPRCFIAYESLLTDWRSCARQMERDLDIEWICHRSPQSEAAIDRFLQPALRHHCFEHRHLDSLGDVGDWLNAVDESLRTLVQDPREPESLRRIDEVYSHFVRARNAFTPGADERRPTGWPPATTTAVEYDADAVSSTPIMVSGCIRAGTTSVARILATARETFYVHEPFNVDSKWNAAFPVPIRYLHIDESNEGPFIGRLERLLALDPAFHGAWLKPQADLLRSEIDDDRTRRGVDCKRVVLMKDPMALFSLPWLTTRLSVRALIVVRDPRDVIASVVRLGWAEKWVDPLSPLERQPRLRTHLDAMAASLGVRGVQAAFPPDHPLTGAARLIYVCYLACAYYTRLLGMPAIGYENLSNSPGDTINRLFDTFGLTPTSATRALYDDVQHTAVDPTRSHGEGVTPLGADNARTRRDARESEGLSYDGIDEAFERLRPLFPAEARW